MHQFYDHAPNICKFKPQSGCPDIALDAKSYLELAYDTGTAMENLGAVHGWPDVRRDLTKALWVGNC